MCQELGYEDEPEFEDALKGSFSDFLDKLPYVIKQEKNGRCGYRVCCCWLRDLSLACTSSSGKSSVDVGGSCSNSKAQYASQQVPERSERMT
jgi:hypothetical protein